MSFRQVQSKHSGGPIANSFGRTGAAKAQGSVERKGDPRDPDYRLRIPENIAGVWKSNEGRKLNAPGRWRDSDGGVVSSAKPLSRGWERPSSGFGDRSTPSLATSMSSISIDSETGYWRGSQESFGSGSGRGSSLSSTSGASGGSAMAFSTGWGSSLSGSSGRSSSMMAPGLEYSYSSSSGGAPDLSGDTTMHADALQPVGIGEEAGILLFPYSLTNCPQLHTTHRMPENKLNIDQVATAHTMLDIFIKQNMPTYHPHCIAQAPNFVSFCQCTSYIWRQRLQAINNNHRVLFERWICSQCGYDCPGLWRLSFENGVQVRIRENACDDCFMGNDYNVYHYANDHQG